jgi:hypothetical protein
MLSSIFSSKKMVFKHISKNEVLDAYALKHIVGNIACPPLDTGIVSAADAAAKQRHLRLGATGQCVFACLPYFWCESESGCRCMPTTE